MLSLTSTEARVLGVLIEKAQTVPAQYPITLNALVSGCNQKNNRDPVTNIAEDEVLDALDGLREKKLAAEVMLSGSRVSKYRHNARETLGVSTSQLVILAELLLRGPQSIGELRGRASRMHPLESLEAVQGIVETLMAPAEGRDVLVRSAPPIPGTRATRFAQLLCPGLHHLEAPASAGARPHAARQETDAATSSRIEKLESELNQTRLALRSLAQRLGQPDPFDDYADA